MADEHSPRRRRKHRRRRSHGDGHDGKRRSHHSSRRRSGRHRRSSRSHDASPSYVESRDDALTYWGLATFAYWFVFALLMHLPGSSLPADLVPREGDDRLLHGAAYAGFAFLLCRSGELWYRRSYPTTNPPIWIHAAVFLGCVFYGYVDEATQPLTGRTSDTADWEADVLGALIGVCAALFHLIFVVPNPPNRDIFAEQEERRRRRRKRRRHRRKHRSTPPREGRQPSPNTDQIAPPPLASEPSAEPRPPFPDSPA